jgi:hypothetical protein
MSNAPKNSRGYRLYKVIRDDLLTLIASDTRESRLIDVIQAKTSSKEMVYLHLKKLNADLIEVRICCGCYDTYQSELNINGRRHAITSTKQIDKVLEKRLDVYERCNWDKFQLNQWLIEQLVQRLDANGNPIHSPTPISRFGSNL